MASSHRAHALQPAGQQQEALRRADRRRFRGGAFLGLTRDVTSAFVFGSVVTFPAFVNGDMMNFINAMIVLGIST
ncbi:MAG: hypothetical protein Q4A07_04675 [Coriobacteriales bacterium]|nr:hypothetical protein [Coriobacteriales bacterium]